MSKGHFVHVTWYGDIVVERSPVQTGSCDSSPYNQDDGPVFLITPDTVNGHHPTKQTSIDTDRRASVRVSFTQLKFLK
jgi:hypothetical protein